MTAIHIHRVKWKKNKQRAPHAPNTYTDMYIHLKSRSRCVWLLFSVLSRTERTHTHAFN